jgi:hypothetical protein
MNRHSVLFILVLICFSCETTPEIAQEFDNSQTEEEVRSEPYMYNLFAKDVPLCSNLVDTDLKYYDHYGQFLDGDTLDFYTADYPGFSFLNVQPSSIVLEYRNGILVRKRYSFDHDIFETLNSYYFKKINYMVKDDTKVIGLNFTTKKLTYNRVSPFFLYETSKDY